MRVICVIFRIVAFCPFGVASHTGAAKILRKCTLLRNNLTTAAELALTGGSIRTNKLWCKVGTLKPWFEKHQKPQHPRFPWRLPLKGEQFHSFPTREGPGLSRARRTEYSRRSSLQVTLAAVVQVLRVVRLSFPNTRHNGRSLSPGYS